MGASHPVGGYKADLAHVADSRRQATDDGASLARDHAREEGDRALQENSASKDPRKSQQRPRGGARRDTRPVRGVIEIQSHPTKKKASKAKRESVLLIAGKGVLKVQEMSGTFPDILQLPLREVLVKLVPGHDCGFAITVFYSEDDAEEVYAALPDNRLRNKWLEALSNLGARVEGDWHWHPTSSGPDKNEVYCALNGQPPPIRWIW